METVTNTKLNKFFFAKTWLSLARSWCALIHLMQSKFLTIDWNGMRQRKALEKEENREAMVRLGFQQ